MATARYPDGRVVAFDESPELVEYYEGEGATVSGTTAEVAFPRVFDGEKYVEPEQDETASDKDVTQDDVDSALSGLRAAGEQAQTATADLAQATKDLSATAEQSAKSGSRNS